MTGVDAVRRAGGDEESVGGADGLLLTGVQLSRAPGGTGLLAAAATGSYSCRFCRYLGQLAKTCSASIGETAGGTGGPCR